MDRTATRRAAIATPAGEALRRRAMHAAGRAPLESPSGSRGATCRYQCRPMSSAALPSASASGPSCRTGGTDRAPTVRSKRYEGSKRATMPARPGSAMPQPPWLPSPCSTEGAPGRGASAGPGVALLMSRVADPLAAAAVKAHNNSKASVGFMASSQVWQRGNLPLCGFDARVRRSLKRGLEKCTGAAKTGWPRFVGCARASEWRGPRSIRAAVGMVPLVRIVAGQEPANLIWRRADASPRLARSAVSVIRLNRQRNSAGQGVFGSETEAHSGTTTRGPSAAFACTGNRKKAEA